MHFSKIITLSIIEYLTFDDWIIQRFVDHLLYSVIGIIYWYHIRKSHTRELLKIIVLNISVDY